MIDYKEVNSNSITNYLMNLGMERAKKSTKKYSFFLSPFTNEKDASFCVNEKTNRFNDYSSGLRGSLLDLVMAMDNLSLNQAAEKVGGGNFAKKFVPSSKIDEIRLFKVMDIEQPSLFDYIRGRGIDFNVAKRYLKEVHYKVYGKHYYALGFKNISKGWELRNPVWKGCIAPKDISMRNKYSGSEKVNVFEGFFDFLAYLTFRGVEADKRYMSVILNSAALKERVNYPNIRFFGDNDAAGDEVFKYFDQRCNVEDFRYVYKGYKDLNEWLIAKK